jgi:hypothetical protein
MDRRTHGPDENYKYQKSTQKSRFLDQRPATGPRDQFFRLLGIYFINMELI